MDKQRHLTDLESCKGDTTLPEEGSYWPLPLYVTRQTPGRPSGMKSLGIMASIRSDLKTSLNCFVKLLTRGRRKN